MEFLNSISADTETIQNYWDTATESAGTYVSTINEALSIMSSFQNKLQSFIDLESRLTSGKGTDDDLLKLLEMGADISDFQLTPEGWKMSGDSGTEAMQKAR
jgi:hypothetical protein